MGMANWTCCRTGVEVCLPLDPGWLLQKNRLRRYICAHAGGKPPRSTAAASGDRGRAGGASGGAVDTSDGTWFSATPSPERGANPASGARSRGSVPLGGYSDDPGSGSSGGDYRPPPRDRDPPPPYGQPRDRAAAGGGGGGYGGYGGYGGGGGGGGAGPISRAQLEEDARALAELKRRHEATVQQRRRAPKGSTAATAPPAHPQPA